MEFSNFGSHLPKWGEKLKNCAHAMNKFCMMVVPEGLEIQVSDNDNELS